MTALDEIRGRLPILPPLKAEHVASDEDGWLYASITHNHTLQDGTVCNQHLATVDSDEDYAEFIAHAPTDVARLLAAVEAVTALHKPRTEQVITGDCAEEACDHEESDDCPKSPFEVCSECWRVAEEADAYFSEGAISIVAYPCPTVKAITAALEAGR